MLKGELVGNDEAKGRGDGRIPGVGNSTSKCCARREPGKSEDLREGLAGEQSKWCLQPARLEE